MILEKLKHAATILETNRLANTALVELDRSLRPPDADVAYEIQKCLNQKLSRSNLGCRAGYKIGCTTPVLQKYMNIHEPIYGEIFSNTIFRDEVVLDLSNYVKLGIETEIAVQLDADLPDIDISCDMAKVADAIDAVMISIELVDARYEDFRMLDTPTLIADNFFNAGVILGPRIANWRELDLATLEAFVTLNSQKIGNGKGSMIMGHPLNALTWLANKLCARGAMLQAGQIITLGSMVVTHWAQPGDTIHHHIAELGSISVTVKH